MAVNTFGLNRTFPIYNADGTSFNNLELRKAVVDSIVMSLGDKITGEVYYKDNSLAVTMHEYIDYNGVHYMLVNPPTVVREGMVSDNGQLNGATKYSFEFYHPMYLLGNIPFNDVAVTDDETRYLSENAVFSWIGYPDDLIAKLNKNLQGTEWIVVKSSRFPNEKDNELSEVIPFNNATISDVLKTFYDTWEVPFVIGQVESTEAAYAQGKRFKVIFGLPYNEIYETPEDRSGNIPFVFQFGQGVGLKNNSRTPRNNKIVTRIAGYGAERNVPYGYPQIPWYGDSRWDWTEYEGDVINYDINDKVTNNPKSTAYPIYDGIVSGQPTRLIKHPFTRTHLMPSIYGELLFNKVSPYISGGGVNPSYNPNIQLKDFYDAIATQEYPYINEINPSAPSYQFKEFEKIYPELGEEYIYGVQPLNDDLTPAPDWDDSIDNDGNYNQSYFAITLPILSFDIYASAAITEEMEINMRSGACLGCTFQVQVDWEDYKNNFFNSDGEFDPIPHTAENDGHVRDAKKYPDSSQTRVTVIVKKDLETFGTLMPNIYQYPIAGDQFVVLGISMPQSYISNAEARLDAEMKTYMLENNVYYFDYPLKFDEKFLRDNTYILSQLRPNSIVHFNYAGQQLQLYVKQLTVKYGEKPLPQYDITLTDNVEVVLNQLGQVADDVERLSTLISIVRENYSRSVWAELAKKLSKVDDDTAQGTIRFLKGLQVGSRFVSGLLGSGGIFRRNADGKTYLETDNLYVRMKAYFDTVEVREYEHSHGGRIASSAGQKVSHVVKMGYYPEGSQTKVHLDDNNNYHYIDPVTGDETLIPLDVCCYRCYYRAKENRDTTEQATRQNTFKRGDMARCHMVNDSLNQKDYWRIVDETNEHDTFYNGEYGWTDLTNEAHFDVTGTSTCWGYMGASSGEAADVPEMGDDLYQLGSVTDADRQGAIVEATTGNDTPAYRIYQSVGKDLRPTPAQGQPPLSEFDPFTLEDRDYIDLFYNSATGRAQMDVYGDAYIGSKDRSTTYIKYTQDDGTQQHRPKLEIKALINVLSSVLDGNTTYNSLNDYLSAKTYTQAQVDAMIEGIQEQIDGEIDTWFYDYMPVDFEATEPANKVPLLFYEKDGVSYPCQPYYDWFVADHGDPTTTPITQPTTDVERNKHLGDIFYDNSTGYAFRFSRNSTTQAFEWEEITDSAVIKALHDAAQAQDTADHKRRVFLEEPVPPYDAGDLWVNAVYPANYTGETDAEHNNYNNDLLRCSTSKAATDSFAITDWELASKYTDDTYAHTFDYISNAMQAMQGSTLIAGGLILSQLIALRDSSNNIQSGLSGIINTMSYTGGGIASWYGGNMGDIEHQSEYPALQALGANARWAKSLFRFDGSGYVANGNLTWDNTGKLTIKQVFWGNEDLTNFFNSFNVGLVANQLRITPKGDFTILNVLDDIKIGGTLVYDDTTHTATITGGSSVATQSWVGLNYVTKEFFNAIFQLQDASGNAITPNNATTAKDRLKILVGAYTDQYLSALGLNPNSGGGGGTGDVTWTALAQTATDNRAIDWSYIANAVTQQGYITSALLAEYLITNGYATQSWVGQQGYITSSSLSGYATESWVNSLLANYYTKSQVDSLTWLQGISQEESGLLTISVHGGEGYILDLTHSHSFYEIVNRPNTLNGYGITDALNSSTTFWGQNAISGGNVSGSIEAGNSGGSIGGFHSIELNSHGTLPDYGGYVDFHFNGSSSDFTSRIIEKASGIVSIESISTAGLVIGGSNGDFVQIGAIRIGYDSANNALKVYKIVSGSEVAANLYALGGISALGYGVSGGSGSGDVTWTALAQTAASGRFIDWSYIETAVTAQGYITTALLATYLSTNGYATQSWVQSLGYVTQSWVQSQGYVTNAVNDISWVADGVLRFAVTNGNNIDIDFNHTHSWYDLNNRPDIDRAFVNLFDDATHFSRIYADNDGLNVSFTNASGSQLSVNGDLEATGEIYESNARVATRTWVGLNYTNTTDLQTMLGNYLLKSGGTMTGTLYMGVGTYFRLYEDANSYASIYANATDGLSIGFSGGATVAAINLDANTEIGGALGVTGNVTVGHPNTNGGYIQIGGVRLVYDSTNNALYVVSSDGSTAAHFYATGGVSALGNGISGGGGGGTGDVTWTALAAQSTNNRTIHSSYIADTLANYLLVSGGTVTGDLTLLGNVFATSAAFNINHLYLTTGFRIQMVDRTGNDNHNVIAFDTNNNFVFSLGTHNAKFIASDLLVGTNTVWHGGNFPLAVSSPTSGQVLKFNGTSWVNDTVSVDGIGDINWVTDGILRFSKANGNVIDVDFNHTHSWYDLTSKPDIDKAHISLYDDTIHYVRIYSDNDGLNVSFTNASGSQLQINGDLLVMSEIYESDSRIATRSWVQSQGYVLSSALNGYLPLSAGTSYPIAGTLCLSALNEIRLYQDATRYAKIVPDTSDGLTIGFSSGNTLNQLNLPSNTYIGSEGVASQEWVGRQGFAYTSQIPTVPTAVSAFINDVGYITISALTGYATQSWVTNTALAGFATQNWVMNTALSGYATQSWVQSQGYASNAVNNITWVSDGLLEFVTSSGNNIKVDFNHTHSWYDLTSKPDFITNPVTSTLRFNTGCKIYMYDDSTHYSSIYADGDGLNVVFSVSSGNQLYVSGDLYVSGTIDSGSDSRRKNITEYDVEPNLWDIAYAPTVRFTWKDMNDNREHLGSIAQYWQIICPECVNKNSKGYLGMQYDVIALLSAISIAKKTIEHERRISELERENDLLRYEIEQLKAV